jgi:hypothetical protein
LKRISIGWVKENPIPGTASSRASLIFSTSSPLVRAVVHSERGFSITNTSPSSMPMTSVASSGLPERLTTVVTSGNRFRTRSIRPVPAATSEMATEAGRMALIEMSPSSSRGMNSPPSRVPRRPPAPTATRPVERTSARCRKHVSSARRYRSRSRPTKRGSCSWPVFRRKSEARTGVRVRVRRRDPARAKTTVQAIGLNILPSMPPRVRIGR